MYKFRPYQFLLCLFGLLFVACANPGSGPDGGPYDETPPRILHMSPALGQMNAKAKRISIAFDEYIKVENITEKVTISPPQQNQPEINVSGRNITIELQDSLLPNTTYTVDFSDAISDNNEGNPLGNFTYYFSTGESVDTLQVSGHVLSADDLEPIKGILVGLHLAEDDTAFTTRPFLRTARTDGNGRFSIKGVALGEYNIYALNDMDGDFRFSQKGEMIAWGRIPITPSSYQDVRRDTVWRDTVTIDSIRTTPFTHFTPDNLVLLAFKEAGQPRHFLKAVRDVPEYFRTYFTAPSAHVPTIRGLNFDATNAFLEDRSKGNDTITYWIRQEEVWKQDSLQFIYTYEDYLDSTKTLRLVEDTLLLVPRLTNVQRAKLAAKAKAEFEKALEKRHKKGDFSQETMPVTPLEVRRNIAARPSPTDNPTFILGEPAATIDTAGIHLLLTIDSTKVVAPFRLERSPYNHEQFTLFAEWRSGQKYTLTIDSAAIRSIYGKVNNPSSQQFAIATVDDYGAVFVSLAGTDGKAVVQLLQGGKVVAQEKEKSRQADFFYVKPGNYHLRLFIDENGNGIWDTGDYATKTSPEEVFYYPMAFDVRAGWDVEKTFAIDRNNLASQKPRDLVKQKDDKKKTSAHQRNIERQRNK